MRGEYTRSKELAAFCLDHFLGGKQEISKLEGISRLKIKKRNTSHK